MSGTFTPDLLAGKVAYVAGGTRGMNLAIARRFGEYGAKVAVMSRNPERCAAAQVAIEAVGTEALGIPCDARDYDAVADSLRQTAETFGSIDLVVAGQAGNFYAPVTGMSTKGFQTVIDIDLVGTFNVFKACLDHLNMPGASLIAITAPEAVRPLHFQAHVCAAKAGVNQLVRVLAQEWGPAGVRVNGISPGPIEGSWGMDNVASPNPQLVETIRRAVPLKRWGTEDDIANTALFLSSPAASWITGTIIETDGGITIASPEMARFDSIEDLANDPRVKRRS
ncbi:MAG: SDR family oxidoreductase [Myxococcota bacterium]|jgi:NAD(P)-dependent dehydrogenase (short-subunit alcohol dehydrogenase family)|nr:SDR family oxidoreductase [Myxococcota bacterium]